MKVTEDKQEMVDHSNLQNGNFLCGVVEGFYGRPWTTEQRKDLFAKLSKWGMNSYLYAPKDDCKHRAFWRELYTVEEAEHLTSLINSAQENGIIFYYALSPGLDITYSSSKELACLKRKLEQVSQFGCVAFALLFDDIEPEMSEADKEVFQSFAHAQVSVTNEVYQHLNQPQFLFCPTQYCAARAVPTVRNSEYLNTIGAKLAGGVDVMWTGPKVISRVLTVESVEEITEVLHRPPVIWDNLHANDYDQKRLFLGPYSGRSADLIPKLRGVLTNPNCEYGANFIAIHTLSQWSRCSTDGKLDLSINDAISADIKLETETEDGNVEDVPSTLSPNCYHPRQALKLAIKEWLLDFRKPKSVWGPISKPQMISAGVPVPSVNTCMTVTHTTLTGVPNGSLPSSTQGENNVNEITGDSTFQPTSTTLMNSLVSENKVMCGDNSQGSSVLNPDTTNGDGVVLDSLQSSSDKDDDSTASDIVPEPMDCIPTPPLQPAPLLSGSKLDVNMDNESDIPPPAPSESDMVIEEDDQKDYNTKHLEESELNVEDVLLLCDLFYLPFEHGAQGLQILQEFNWLKVNGHLVSKENLAKSSQDQPEVKEWYDRATKFEELAKNLTKLFNRLTLIQNRELLYDLYPYVWDMRGVVSLLNSYVKFLGFSKGWKETFMSGEQEPWVFRGGLTADLQRLLPVDSGQDLFLYKIPDIPVNKVYTIRPYLPGDEKAVYDICQKTCNMGLMDSFSDYPNLLGDKLVGPFLTLSPEFCFVVEDESEIVAYLVMTRDVRQFNQRVEMAWIPDMCSKYTRPEKDGEMLTPAEEMIESFYTWKSEVLESVVSLYPATLQLSILPSVIDQSIARRLLSCALASLRANGCFGCHAKVHSADKNLVEFYERLGLLHINPVESGSDCVYLGRVC